MQDTSGVMIVACIEKLNLDRSTVDHDAIAHRLQEDVVSCLWHDYYSYMLL